MNLIKEISWKLIETHKKWAQGKIYMRGFWSSRAPICDSVFSLEVIPDDKWRWSALDSAYANRPCAERGVIDHGA